MKRTTCATLTALSLLLMNGACASAEYKEEPWISTANVSSEYEYIREHKCECGGDYEVTMQIHASAVMRECDILKATCAKCGKRTQFVFDITNVLFDYRIIDKWIRKRAYSKLDAKYPSVTVETIPALRELLHDSDEYTQQWAVERLAKIDVPEARELLLDTMTAAEYPTAFVCKRELARIGALAVAYIKRRIDKANPDARVKMIELLGEIECDESRELVEAEMERGPDGSREACYFALGALGYGASEPLLLKRATASDDPNPYLVWALGRLGTSKAVPLLRKLAKSDARETRLAAIAALGAIGDQESVPALMKVAASGDDNNARYNAIYSLGLLRAPDAVPLLLDYVRDRPRYAADYEPVGVFDGDAEPGDDLNYIGVSAQALGRIGDRRAIAEFERILKDDAYYYNFASVANAAAEAGWKELVPFVIDRMEKECKADSGNADSRRELYSPALRKLTGQIFGEDPKAWRDWMRGASDRKGSGSVDSTTIR